MAASQPLTLTPALRLESFTLILKYYNPPLAYQVEANKATIILPAPGPLCSLWA
jgi:hypothetical protein